MTAEGSTGAPLRIQRKRTKGWRMPEGAVYVGRPSRWGNPFKVGDRHPYVSGLRMDHEDAAALFATVYGPDSPWHPVDADRLADELRGRTLACWCRLDQPCHGDFLLLWANR